MTALPPLDSGDFSANPFEDDKLREECGVFGIWGKESASAMAHACLTKSLYFQQTAVYGQRKGHFCRAPLVVRAAQEGKVRLCTSSYISSLLCHTVLKRMQPTAQSLNFSILRLGVL